MNSPPCKVAVVIPCYRVRQHILGLIAEIGEEVSCIYVVDDHCPDGSGDYVEQNCKDKRVVIIRNERNLGVGGAMKAGYTQALDDEMEVILKLDGDGQMDPALIPVFIRPIVEGQADYVKGNRFFNVESVKSMPKHRIFGNACLSFMTKLSSGYWELFDPTNGYTAIHAETAKRLPLSKLSNSYFFESDMLFRLNTIRAVVVDIPMEARYGDEVSNMQVSNVILEFLGSHIRNFWKRIFYNYYLRGMSLASLQLPIGLGLSVFGLVFGAYHWITSVQSGIPTTAGTVMLAALPILVGLQLILAFLAYDMSTTPRLPISRSTIHKHATSFLRSKDN